MIRLSFLVTITLGWWGVKVARRPWCEMVDHATTPKGTTALIRGTASRSETEHFPQGIGLGPEPAALRIACGVDTRA